MIDRDGRKAKSRAFGLSNRGGRSALVVLAALAAAVFAVIWLWERPQRGSPDPAPRAGAPGAPRAPHASEPAGAPIPSEPTRTAATRESAQGESANLTPLGTVRAADDERFRGRGELRGHVEVSSEEPFPTSWRLEIRPSTTLAARELAIERTVEFEDGRQDFTVADLPLAGYDVYATADGWSGEVQSVLLDKRNASPFLNLRLARAGFLEGSVVDEAGIPIEDITITLLSLPDGETIEARSNTIGKFRFERVMDGPYQLIVGPETSPIVPERTPLRFRAPSMILPPIELPPLGRIELVVLDQHERAMSDVEVRGSGNLGGVFSGTTDHAGHFTARHLPEGRYRIRMAHEGMRLKRVSIELSAGEVRELPLQMVPELP